MRAITFQKLIIIESGGQAKKLLISIILIVLFHSLAFAEDPDCTGVDRWPTRMAFVHLKNAGLTDNDKLDFTKTKTIRLASEKIDKNLYRQVHYIMFTEKSGNAIEVITINEASNEECSMSGVDVFVVSQHLGNGTLVEDKNKNSTDIKIQPFIPGDVENRIINAIQLPHFRKALTVYR